MPAPSSALDRIARTVANRLVLVHRNFPNEQMPVLAYLAIINQPVPVIDVYNWLEQNELNIKNPANQVLRLKDKGHVATFDQEGSRYIVLTDEGRKAIEDYSNSLGQT